jgi:hypothetical protein
MSNVPFALAVFTIAILVAIARELVRRGGRSITPLRYKAEPLFNSTEHQFFIALRAIAPAHIAVLAKVRVADLVLPATRNIAAFNRISRRHVDFVLYNTQNRCVLRAIELDGPTHNTAKARKGDYVKNSSFASARITLTRVAVSNWNNPAKLRELFIDERDQQILGQVQSQAQRHVGLRTREAARHQHQPNQQLSKPENTG